MIFVFFIFVDVKTFILFLFFMFPKTQALFTPTHNTQNLHKKFTAFLLFQIVLLVKLYLFYYLTSYVINAKI